MNNWHDWRDLVYQPDNDITNGIVHEGADLVDQRGTYGAEKVQHNM